MAPKPASLKAEKKAKFKVRALFDYLSDNADDLSFAEGAIIDVFEADEGDDWWKGSVVGGPSRTASFPRNYVERI